MILFFDTETTGLVKDWNKFTCPLNPKLVQLGLLVCDNNGRNIATYGRLIIPYYPKEQLDIGAMSAHGITYEMAEKYGVPLKEALDTFISFSKNANKIIAHNIKFDECVIMGAIGNENRLVNTHCTMIQATPVCKMPTRWNKGYKWPKLSEAYYILFNEELIDAHDALTDVMACKRIYYHLNNEQKEIKSESCLEKSKV